MISWHFHLSFKWYNYVTSPFPRWNLLVWPERTLWLFSLTFWDKWGKRLSGLTALLIILFFFFNLADKVIWLELPQPASLSAQVLTTQVSPIVSSPYPACLSRPVVSDSVRPHGLLPHQAPLSIGIPQARILEEILQGIFPTPRIKPWSPVLQTDSFTVWATKEAISPYPTLP